MIMRMPIRTAFAALALIALPPSVRAASLTWDALPDTNGVQDGAGTWDGVATNWWNGTANTNWTGSNPDTAIFGATNGAAGTVTVSGTQTVAGITFNTPGSGVYTISGGTLELTNNPTLAVNAAATIASTIDGSASLTKSGSAPLTLTAANTFAGGTTISAGLLILSNDTAMGSGSVSLNGGGISRNNPGSTITNAISVGAGGGAISGRLVVDNYVTFSGPVSGSGALTVTGLVAFSNSGNPFSGAITIPAANSYLKLAANDAMTNNAVTLGTASSYLTLNAGTTSTVASLNGTAGNVFNQSSTPSMLIVGGANGSGSFGGTIYNGGGPMNLVKIGTGTQTLTAASSYNGATVVKGGVLALNQAGTGFNVGMIPGSAVTINTGGTLRVANTWNINDAQSVVIAGGTLNIANTNGTATDGLNYMNFLTFTNGGLISGQPPRMGYFRAGTMSVTGSGTATNSAGVHLLNNGQTVTFAVADTTGDTNVDLVVSGPVVDDTGSTGAAMVKSGAGTMLVTASNYFSGGFTISQGAVIIRSNYSMGSQSTVTLGNAGTGTNTVAFLLDGAINGWNFPRPMVVSANGSGPAIVGTTVGGAPSLVLSGTLQMNRATTLLAWNSDRTTFSGVLSGNAGTVTIAGGSRVTMENSNTYTAQVNITTSGSVLQIGNPAGGQYDQIPDWNSVDLAAGTFLRFAFGDSEAIDGLTGAGVVEPITGAAYTFTVGSRGGGGTFPGIIRDANGGTIALIKNGTGTETLAGTNTYTGATTINAGTLTLSGGGSITASPTFTLASNAVFDVSAAGFTLASGKTLQGFGSVTGSFVAASGSRVIPGGAGTAGALTFNGRLAESATTTNYFELSSSTNSGNDQIAINGDLDPSNAVISISLFSPLSLGTYTLFTFTGTNASLLNPTVVGSAAQSRQTLALDQTGTPGRVNLVVSGNPASLSWISTASTNWDVQVSSNWYNGSQSQTDLFYQGDNVVFDDAPGVVTNIGVSTAIYPSSIAVNASTNNFTIAGGGSLAGLINLTKAGAGALTLGTANSYAGTTTISNGSLVVAANGALGSSMLTMDGGATLTQIGSRSLANTVTVNGASITLDDAGSNLTLSGPISGPAALVKRGAATTTLSASNSFAGGVTVNAGTLTAGNVYALGTGSATVTTNATLTLGTLAATNSITVDGGALGITAGGTWGATVTLTAASNTIYANSPYAVWNGKLTGAGGFTLTGVNTPGLQLANPGNDFAGNVTIASGAYLRLTTNEVMPDTAIVNVASNGNFRLEGGGLTETVAGLTGSGTVWVPTSSDNHTLRIGAQNTSCTFDGTIGSPGQHLTITTVKIGNGTLTLTGSNTYTSATLVQGGVLDLTTGSIYNGGYRSARVTVQSNALLRLNNLGYGDGLSLGQLTYNTYEAADTPPSDIAPVPANAHLVIDGGHIDICGGTQANGHGFIVTSAGGSISVTNPAATVTFNASSGPTQDIYLWGALQLDGAGNGTILDKVVTGTGSVVKTGSGTWTLGNTNTFTGGLAVSNGSLHVNGSTGAGDVLVATGGTLGGTGVVNGLLTIDGTLAPGTTVGTLTVNSNVTFNPSATFLVELGGSNACDLLNVSLDVSAAGTLKVALTNGHVPAAGNSYTVLTAFTINDNFTSNDLPALDPGLAWSVTNTGYSIVLSVSSNVAPPSFSGYDAYSNAFSLASGPTGDANGDGWQNLAAYALGFDPTGATHAGLSGGIVSGKLSLTFDVLDSRSDITYWAETADAISNGATWTMLWTNKPVQTLAGANSQVLSTSGETNTVRVSDPNAGTNRFLRLRITRP